MRISDWSSDVCSSDLKGVQVKSIRGYLEKVYNSTGAGARISELTDDEVIEMARNLKNGVPLATPVFDGATEEEITQMLELAYPDDIAEKLKLTETRSQAWLADGRTGERFERPEIGRAAWRRKVCQD